MAAKPGGGLLLEWSKSQNFKILLRIYTGEKFSALRDEMVAKPGGVVARDSSDHADGKVSASVVNMTLNDALSVDN